MYPGATSHVERLIKSYRGKENLRVNFQLVARKKEQMPIRNKELTIKDKIVSF